MAFELESSSPLDNLWQEYASVFEDWDDLTLARWLSQTLGQLEGRSWRLSHPLVGTYRLAAKIAHDRQVWLKRLATPPAAYAESPCCRAPLLPLLTRDVHAEGLICQHCNEILVPFDELPEELRGAVSAWAQQYEPVHAVAHWDDRQRRRVANYDDAFENAARQAEQFLNQCGRELAPKLLGHYPAVIWEDQDECLEVRPEDVAL
jgi:FAD/FMN-containing dehydrogenase